MDNVKNAQQILEKWMNVKGKLSVASIPDADLRMNMAVLLENQMTSNTSDLFESDVTTTNFGSNGGDGARFSPITLALVRRSYYEHFAHKCIGFQTMQGPVGLAYALRKVYDIPGFPGSSTYLGGSDSYEAAFRALNEYSGYTGSQAGSALTTPTSAIYDPSSSAYGMFGTGAVTSAAQAWKIGTTMPSLRLFMDKVAIEAKTRKLAASFSLEAAQDLKSMQNIDIEREMLEILAAEIPAERDREIIGRMMQASVNTNIGGKAAVVFDCSGSDGRWSQEKFSNIINVITQVSNEIAQATFRGAATFVIVSNRVATSLQSCSPQFTANTADVNASTTVTEIGKINGTITVYRDSQAPVDYALLGYKGPGINDTGIILSDYITGLTNKAIRPDDFGTNVGVMSRYCITDSLLGAGRYYRTIKFTNLDKVIGA